MSARFHFLEDIRFSDGILNIVVADLNEGEPDGLIGLPLVVNSQSSRHLVKFTAIAGFQSVPEPLNGLSAAATELAEFLYLDPESAYLSELEADGPTFVFGAERPYHPSLRHYVIYGENTVVHVLAAGDPVLVSPYEAA